MTTNQANKQRYGKRFFSIMLPALLLFGIFPGSADCNDGWSLFRKKVVSAAITTVQANPEFNYINVKWVMRNQCTDGTYLIERSTDGENFEIVGLRRGVAAPNSEMEFYFVDKEPPTGQVFYRIRHFGNDNMELLSKAFVSSTM
jgi:hypothetical protein